ncbi:MAG: ABC transporter permease [Anaerolineaceae bacterium]|nr:ABC transporter permease [Anaerolineaceae bacterium]
MSTGPGQPPATSPSEEDVATLVTGHSRQPSLLSLLRRSPIGLIGTGIISLVIVLAVVSPLIVPHDPIRGNLRTRYKPPGFIADDGATHLLGTDQLGRDIFSRILVGSRVSVLVGVVAVMIAGTIGVLYGLTSGFLGGRVDGVMMRICDAMLSIPFVIRVVAISGIVGPGLVTLILILGLSGWVTYARVIRGEVLKARENDYVMAAWSIGQRPLWVVLHHILPNVIASAIVLAALQVGITMLAESSLSFLGLGVKPPTVTWGIQLADGKSVINSAWWMTTYPGIAITITVLGVVFLGDWLRDSLDPNVRGRD